MTDRVLTLKQMLAECRRGDAVPVWMSRQFVEHMGGADSTGRKLSMNIGEPDEDGFYNPIITRHEDRIPELERLRAERDLLRAALAKLEYEDLSQGCNEEGEDYMTCTRCDVQEWGSVDVHEPGDVRHDGECPYAALAAVDAFDKEASK